MVLASQARALFSASAALKQGHMPLDLLQQRLVQRAKAVAKSRLHQAKPCRSTTRHCLAQAAAAGRGAAGLLRALIPKFACFNIATAVIHVFACVSYLHMCTWKFIHACNPQRQGTGPQTRAGRRLARSPARRQGWMGSRSPWATCAAARKALRCLQHFEAPFRRWFLPLMVRLSLYTTTTALGLNRQPCARSK